MSVITRLFRRLSMSTRRHPWRNGLIGLVVVACVAGIMIVIPIVFPPFCGPGMSTDGDACVGVDLASGPIARSEPAEMTALETDLRANNDIRNNDGKASQDYVSIVLLQDMSPAVGIDTRAYPDVYPDIEGVITAAWQANHTAAIQGSLPKVKIFLGNMGSQYAHWSEAVDQIAANVAANHITAVIGLGQSTDETRAAAARIVDKAHLPVIGATVSGDTMNLYPHSTKRNNGFFRVTPTNTDLVAIASRYVARIEPDQTHVAIVQDNVPGDDYNQTLAKAADSDMPSAHEFPFTSPRTLPAGIERTQELIQQFSFLDENICSVAPTVIYFAARGADLGAFVQTWTQTGTLCANRKLTIVTGDDGGAAINDAAVHQAIRSGRVRVLFTAEASVDEWGPCPTGQRSIVQTDYDTFQAAFTGQPDVCAPHQHVVPDDGAPPLSFGLSDLRSGESILAHDAAVVAITAARRADLGTDTAADGGTVVRDPYSQVGFIEEMRCAANAVHGASGLIQYSTNPADYGNPIDKPMPIVEVHADGSIKTLPGITVPTDPIVIC